jgi:CheY-like chemotaxis protein
MSERKELFVLVVAADRVIAATLATVLHAGGYMAASTASGATSLRIAGRMVIDAAVIDLAANRPLDLETAVALQNKYPDCRILLVCSSSQLDEAAGRSAALIFWPNLQRLQEFAVRNLPCCNCKPRSLAQTPACSGVKRVSNRATAQPQPHRSITA